jgi:predicted PurR-regulated permease PerM
MIEKLVKEMKNKADFVWNKFFGQKSGFVGTIDEYGNIINKKSMPKWLRIGVLMAIFVLFVYLFIIIISFLLPVVFIAAIIGAFIYLLNSLIFKDKIDKELESKVKVVASFFFVIILTIVIAPIAILGGLYRSIVSKLK